MAEEDSSGTVKQFTRTVLFNILNEFKGKKIDEKVSLFEERLLKLTNCPNQEKINFIRALRCFKSDFKKKWRDASYKEERFLKTNEHWLTSSIELPYWPEKLTQKPGRPSKTFEELCDRSKRRKTKELREQVPVEELTYAAGVSQRVSGHSDASKIIKEIIASPTRAAEIRKVITTVSKQTTVKKHTPAEALAIFVEGDFTRRRWEIIHRSNKSIYPCYSLIQKAKKECYPDEASMCVTETCSEVRLQALLDHTVLRLHKYVAEVVETCSEKEKQNMVLISKWGCDGSQQTQYKQKFQNITDSDANIFQSSLVPLRLLVIIDGEQKKIIWQNPVPSSLRFCRPIRIRFINESKDVTKEEIRHIENQAAQLQETEVDGAGKIKHKIVFTMIDGKVCNAATDTASTMRCYICGQTSKDFDKLIKKDVNVETLKFGLPILHARIRFFESLLHLSYKIQLKKWQARSTEEKKVVKETKEKIQEAFKEEMGLLVDVPKAGFGNTNDGNTSRRFFADPECSSRITGVSVNLIQRFKVILEVISSGNSIDVDKFEAYTYETAKLYTDLYDWHPMSPTIHKVLMHGAEVISHAILPIGQLSEEAAEARNKHLRQYRLNFARKFSRVDCNRDVLYRLLLSSDPYLSNNRPRQHKKNYAIFARGNQPDDCKHAACTS
ncbi:unnamed protein product [Psylliodes chrysocephalus]|uniref:Uncharacterized protein n=1 Tax=Psylliodes chrysocephalus TaxID=3402493 RepID=A0A9P0CII9_9CUCU|nr:unnamed protein product [Psylliodes chrysocephala]